MSAADGGGVRRAWVLDEQVVFLNHGSFGACPSAVLDHQHALRLQLEREPVRFFVRELEGLWDEARTFVARFVGCQPRDLVSVPNATTGVNAVLQSLELEAGDEILLFDQAYPACHNAVADTCARRRVKACVVPTGFPPPDDDTILEAVLSRVTKRTRLALLDHVASPTGTIFPVERLVPVLQARGVRVLIDGAHAPGMIPLDLDALGADYYVGNCHKWLCAPKGAGFLHVAHGHRAGTHPVVVSLGYRTSRRGRSVFASEFGWTGTHDPTAFLSVPFAVDYVGKLHPDGWPGIRVRNHALMREALRVVSAALGLEAWEHDGWFGSMAALPLPDREGHEPEPGGVDPWQDRLFEDHAIEVPVITWPRHPARLIRLSAHLYNDLGDYESLAAALSGTSMSSSVPSLPSGPPDVT